MLQTLIRWAKVVQAAASGKTYPEQLTTAFGKPPSKSITVYPFGFFANASADTIGPELLIGGDSSQPFILPMSVEGRPELEEGEVAVFHPATGSVITMKANGDIDIESTANVNVTATSINSTADTWTHNGNFTLIGNQVSTGNYILQGNYTSNGSMVNNGFNVSNNHTHNGDSGGVTGPVL